MNCSVSFIYYCPVKTLSFQRIESCNIKKKLGMINDRIFAFSRGVDLEKAKSMEANPNERKLINLLTLKNSPTLIISCSPILSNSSKKEMKWRNPSSEK